MNLDVRIRPALAADDRALARLDALSADPGTFVVPPHPGEPFFTEETLQADVFVAELDSRVVGYVKVRPPTTLAANRHVQQIQGLAVHPALRRRGVARALLREARAEATRRGARKLSLRVLSSNPGALALYRSAGYSIEGVLTAEFRISDTDYADDIVMAQPLG